MTIAGPPNEFDVDGQGVTLYSLFLTWLVVAPRRLSVERESMRVGFSSR
jgi:hypothetical protein